MTLRTGRSVASATSRGLAICAAALVVGSAAPRLMAADDVLQRSRDMYAALRSYADTGVIVQEYGSSSKDRYTFTTYFNRAPRRFYFDFHKLGGDRYVVWGDPDAFHTWWKTTGVDEDYPNPNNIGALTSIGGHSYGSGMKITPLLYSKAPLQGDFSNFADAVVDGTEDVGGRRCFRILGTARDVYTATGKEVNIRKMTLWIDAESHLIRKVVEQWKAPPGSINRITTTFEPQANPTLDEARFRFVPPTPKAQ